MEQKTIKISIKHILFVIIAIALVIAIIFAAKNSFKASDIPLNVAPSYTTDLKVTQRSDDREINLSEIVEKNEAETITEKIVKQELVIDFNTQYRENSSLASGEMQTVQNGSDGSQNAVTRCKYKNGEIMSTALISSVVTKPSVDKIVEIGTGSVSSTYVPIVGDKLKVILNGTELKVTPSDDAKQIVMLSIGDEVTMNSKQGDWYYVKKDDNLGWVKKDQVEYINPNSNGDGDENHLQFTKEQLTSTLGFSMLLNTKSGLTIEQFKKILTNDSNDKNHIFADNAEYFYYIEQQYHINGIFVAAVGIHESAWGTSYIAQNKKNLFGYGAYDSDPVGGANNFSEYSAGIDLLARVFMKYYLNPRGTVLADGEIAQGTYYRGATLSAVNQCYASDKNWANGVYKWMSYLYNKI